MEPSGPGPLAATSLRERILLSLPALTRFVRRRMGPELRARESASDIVQSTCRELLRGTSGFEERGEAGFQCWLRSAAEHKLQNRARHWRARDRAELRADTEPAAEASASAALRPSQAAMLAEEAARLERAFRALEPGQQTVLRRSQIDGLSHAELGHELGKSPDAARKLVARALARFSLELEKA